MKLFGYQLSNLSFHKDVDHGPKEFPFYKLFVYSVIPVGEISYRLWVYTRWFAISLDVTPKE